MEGRRSGARQDLRLGGGRGCRREIECWPFQQCDGVAEEGSGLRRAVLFTLLKEWVRWRLGLDQRYGSRCLGCNLEILLLLQMVRKRWVERCN